MLRRIISDRDWWLGLFVALMGGAAFLGPSADGDLLSYAQTAVYVAGIAIYLLVAFGFVVAVFALPVAFAALVAYALLAWVVVLSARAVRVMSRLGAETFRRAKSSKV